MNKKIGKTPLFQQVENMIMAEHPYRVALPFVFANGLQKSVCNFAPEEKKQNYR
ncbi:MAG: hypothetical protein SO068_04480 [Sodaliphilus sp.]|nr:hypothetical protein [Sodaliphilus sp.]